MPVASIVFDTLTPVPINNFQVLNSYQCEKFISANIYVSVTIGNLTSVYVRVEFSGDNTTWYKVSALTIAPPDAEVQEVDYRMSVSGVFRIELPLADKQIRFSVLGEGDNTNSSVKITANFASRE